MQTAAFAAAAETFGVRFRGQNRSFDIQAYTHGKLWGQSRGLVKTFVLKNKKKFYLPVSDWESQRFFVAPSTVASTVVGALEKAAG